MNPILLIILEIEAGLFVYGSKLGFDLKAEASTVSQIDLVPTLSLLLGKLYSHHLNLLLRPYDLTAPSFDYSRSQRKTILFITYYNLICSSEGRLKIIVMNENTLHAI